MSMSYQRTFLYQNVPNLVQLYQQRQHCLGGMYGTLEKSTKMQGLSLAGLRKHTALIPLFVCVGVGCAGSMFYLLRLATRNPEVSWNKKGDQAPWNEYENKQYKFYSPNVDYKEMKSPAPKY